MRFIYANPVESLAWVLNDEVMKGVCIAKDNGALLAFMKIVLRGGCDKRGQCERDGNRSRSKVYRGADTEFRVWVYAGVALQQGEIPSLADIFLE